MKIYAFYFSFVTIVRRKLKLKEEKLPGKTRIRCVLYGVYRRITFIEIKT